MLCRGNAIFFSICSLICLLQFGHGLLCRGNGPGTSPSRRNASGFNSATACYAVETILLARLAVAEQHASIRPRLVMPWKLGPGDIGGPLVSRLQFGHGLLCRGNIKTAMALAAARNASIRPRLVMPWKQGVGKGLIPLAQKLQFGHGLLCRGNEPDRRLP